MRKFILTIICIISGASFLSACAEEDEYLTIDEVRADTTIISDSTFINDTIISKGDTIIKIDTIIKQDTVIKTDTVKKASLEITLYMNQESGNASIQGSAVHNDFLFEFSPSASSVFIYNLKDRVFVQSVKITKNSQDHFNNASFGSFYDINDEFPLLYLSGGNATYNPIDVYRITKKDNSFYFEKIQHISLPVSNDNNMIYWTSVMVDKANNYLYAYSYYNGNVYLSKYYIPSYDTDNIQLTDADILENIKIDSFTNKQGATIKDDCIFMATGIPGQEETTLRIYDLTTKKRKFFFSFRNYGFYYEPEGISFYGDNMILSSQKGRGIYLVKFMNI